MNPSSIRNIVIKPVQTLAYIFCENVLLADVEYISVPQGAVVGVVLPSDHAIPIIEQDSRLEDYLMEGTKSMNIPVSDLSIRNHLILHLYGTSSKYLQHNNKV